MMSWFQTNWQQDLVPIDQDIRHPWTPHRSNKDIIDTMINDIKINYDEKLQFCQKLFANKTVEISGEFCPVTTDGILCFPPTCVNVTAFVKCFAEFNGVQYDETQDVSRECLFNGSWTKADYTNCEMIVPDVEVQTIIYLTGYSLSLVTLSLAFGIFCYFKELRCLRNVIHMHLMCAYMLMYVMWILALTVLRVIENPYTACLFIITLFHYFYTSTFVWMFVEGLYLYILVVKSLRRENFKLRVYVCIGWAKEIESLRQCKQIMTEVNRIINTFICVFYPNGHRCRNETNKTFVCKIKSPIQSNKTGKIDCLSNSPLVTCRVLLVGLPLLFIVSWSVAKSFLPSSDDPMVACMWFNIHPIDWIYQAPTLLILVLNLFFLLSIMWVLITKLRSSNTVEIQQYHKAAKALLVLMPLLGVTYVIIIYSPTFGQNSEQIFESTRAVLLSTQGFTVALFYCFLNTEVQNTIWHHFENWKIQRSIPNGHLRSSTRGRDQYRSESMRITEWTLVSTDDIENHNQI